MARFTAGPRLCPRKHPITGDNLVILSNGYPTCRACRVARSRIPTTRTPEDQAAFQVLSDQVYAADGALPPRENAGYCTRGHRVEEPNLVASALARGHRTCRACNQAHALRYARLRRNPELADSPELDLQVLADLKYRELFERTRTRRVSKYRR